MSDESVCALCDEKKILRNSHIIPDLVFRYLKASSPTGHMRNMSEPNLRAPGGLAVPLLCEDCEARFQKYEDKFARKFFHPIHSEGKRPPYCYSDWMMKFGISVVWRIGIYLLQQDGKLMLEEHSAERDVIDRTLSVWKSFLRDEITNPGFNRLHMVVFDHAIDTTEPLPVNFNRFMARAVKLDYAVGGRQSLIVAKMCRVHLFGIVRDESPADWRNTRVSSGDGLVDVGEVRMPGGLLPYFISKATEVGQSYSGISDKQKKKIASDIEKRRHKTKGNESFSALAADIDMFGLDEVAKFE